MNFLRHHKNTIFKTVGVVVAALMFITGAVLWSAGEEARAATEPASTAARAPTMVRLTPTREMEFSESLLSDGSIKARNYSLVSPRIAGIIDRVEVREGDHVEKDKTLLFVIEYEKLQQAVDRARQNLVIARSTLDEKDATLTKASADLDQAEKDFNRTRSLYEQKVVPLSEYEVDETRVIQMEAQERVAETNVTLAHQNVTLSEINLAMAKKDLRDSAMLSPIDGVISARYSEPGEMGQTAQAILRIDDTKNLKAVAYLPAQFYPRINVRESVAEVTVLDRRIGDFSITYKAPAIDSALRTFEIWADVQGDGAYSVPGAQCVVRVVLRRSNGVGVPRDAVQHRDGKYWIFVPDNGSALMLEVKPGLDTDGWIELVDSPVKAGEPVITQGQFLLNNGYPIRERVVDN